MVKTALTMIVVGLLVAGCAERWTRAGVTNQQADADFYQCQRENKNFSDGSVVGPNGDFAQEFFTGPCPTCSA